MRILLVSANTEQVNMRTLPWGMWCVATSVRAAGHQVATLDLMEAADPAQTVARAVEHQDPQLVGISVRNIDDQRRDSPTFFLPKVRKVVDAARAATRAPIVLGGAGYSIFPERALEVLGADLGVQGEGELALPVLATALEQGAPLERVPGLFARGRGALAQRRFLPMDQTPFPDEECLAELPPADPARPLWVPLQIRRGCALGCAYCSTAIIEGRQVRRRSVPALVGWLARHPDIAARPLYLVDNNFNVPRQPAHDLCRAILDAGLRLKWRCILNPMLFDRELARLMGQAGCQEVALGFESGSDLTLRALNKSFTVDEIARAAGWLQEAGVGAMGFLLLGGPEETRETVQESLSFAAKLPLSSLKLTVGIRIYPDTPLRERAVLEGQIAPDDDLLAPRFYLAPGLEPWLGEEVARWCATRPSWVR
jgi:radical SAM superfamily enzyme YgiQ (UPF0313 family)